MSDQNRDGQKRDEQPESIPTPEPVVDSAFDAIPPAVPGSVPPPPQAPGSGEAATPPVAPPAPPAGGGHPTYPGAAPGGSSPASPQPPYPGSGATQYPGGHPALPYPGSGPAQPGGYPGASPAPGYPGQPYGSAPAAPTARPRHVTTACLLAWVIAALGLFGLVAAMILLSQYPGVDGAFLVGALVIPVIVIIGLAVFAFFTWQGKGWARIALTVMFALNAVGGLANIGNGQPISLLGLVLSIGSIVLLWLPASSAWFRAQRTAA